MPTATAPSAASYDASSIQALEGLAHIRLRPSMYIGSTGITGLHHLLWEVVDNSVDEFLAGVGDRIEITLLADGGVRVRDFGRGMPVDPMPNGPHKGKSAAEVILTVVNAGGKFEAGAYKTSGGLHGIGLKAVTALSTRVDLVVRRDGRTFEQSFALRGDKPGVPTGKVRDTGRSTASERGTEITFWPDLTCFSDENGEPLAGFSQRLIAERLENRCYFHRGLTFVLVDQRPGRDPAPKVYRSEHGLADLVTKLAGSRVPITAPIAVSGRHEAEGIEVDVALAWNAGFAETLIGSSNGVLNPGGGKHVEGMTKAITRAVNRYARDKSLLKDKDENPTGADVRQGLIAAVSVLLGNPSYDSQSKHKLETVQAAGAVESVLYDGLSRWLEEHPADAKRIVDKAIAAMRERKKTDDDRAADRALARKSVFKGSLLPDKLYDCQLSPKQAADLGGTELLLVEGDSAGGTAVDARDPRTQAILPLRGKVLNVEGKPASKVVGNGVLSSLIVTLGCGRGADCDISRLRYDRIVLVADADPDGGHIQALLITFFWRQMTDLVRDGRLFVAQPPLYVTTTKDGKRYFATDAEKDAFVAANPAAAKQHFLRMKGLGEMNADDLAATTLDPATRHLIQVTAADAIAFDDLVSRLMGDSAQARLDWLLETALSDTNLGAAR